MLVLLRYWPFILAWIFGAAVGGFFAFSAGKLNGMSIGHEAGRLEERVLWTEERDRARAKRDADERAAQERIDAVERELHQREQARQTDMNELEAALAEERKNNATPAPTPSPGAPVVCRPSISRGVRDQLQPIGR